jgi:DNA-binding transcriptional MerR regulator
MTTQQEIAPKVLRIDDLARIANIPSRTIRFYNTQGLLPPPIMRGRTAYYDQQHLLVLGIIRELQEQYHLPLETIKTLLEIRDQQGDLQMNLALKQRSLRAFGGQQVWMTKEELLRQSGTSSQYLDTLLQQDLLFPTTNEKGIQLFTGDDLLLINIYTSLEKLGLPLALAALMRFQLRQLVRSEVASCEQYMLPQWHEQGMTLEQQTAQFEKILTLTDTLISTMHRKLLYQD